MGSFSSLSIKAQHRPCPLRPESGRRVKHRHLSRRADSVEKVPSARAKQISSKLAEIYNRPPFDAEKIRSTTSAGSFNKIGHKATFSLSSSSFRVCVLPLSALGKNRWQQPVRKAGRTVTYLTYQRSLT